MFNNIKRKLRACFTKRIPILRQKQLHFDADKLHLVIVRRVVDDQRPLNHVWLLGSHARIFELLFNYDKTCTPLGKAYGATLDTFDCKIDIDNHHDLKTLCRKCRVDTIIIVRTWEPTFY